MFSMTKDILIKKVNIYTLKIPLNKPIKMAGIIVACFEICSISLEGSIIGTRPDMI